MATTPTCSPFTNGLSDASQLEQLRLQVAFLLAKPVFKGTSTVTQIIGTGAYTGMSLDTDVVDTDVDGIGGHDTAVNPSRYTARYPGWYTPSGGIPWPSNATGRRGGRLAVNGTSVTGSGVLINAVSAVGLDFPFDANLVYLNVGDYCELQGFQDSGGNLTVPSSAETMVRFTMQWVSN